MKRGLRPLRHIQLQNIGDQFANKGRPKPHTTVNVISLHDGSFIHRLYTFCCLLCWLDYWYIFERFYHVYIRLVKLCKIGRSLVWHWSARYWMETSYTHHRSIFENKESLSCDVAALVISETTTYLLDGRSSFEREECLSCDVLWNDEYSSVCALR